MKLEFSAPKLRFLSVQLIDRPDGVVIKRGALETHIRGANAGEIVRSLVETFSEGGALRDDFVAGLPHAQRADVERLLDQLLDRRLLVPADSPEAAGAGAETELDIFYWNSGTNTRQVLDALNEKSITILGVNAISQRIASALLVSGVENVTVVDFLRLRSFRFFDPGGNVASSWRLEAPLEYEFWADSFDPESAGTVVATSDFGGLHWMREWNELCVENGVRFFPVVLQNLVGYIGPIVLPGETACFECLRARQNSHLVNAELARAIEREAALGQHVNAMHPSMASIIGDIAAIELVKLHSGAIAPPHYSHLIEVRLLEPDISRHPVLRVPRCPVCSTMRTTAPVSVDRTTFLPGNRGES
jgi:bacteriocin biosynthesis cyclodehydratase domain-containing protein